MNKAVMLGGVMLLFMLVGVVSGELGLTSSIIDIPDEAPPAPGGGFWESIAAALAPLAYVFNTLGSIFQILTFQVEMPIFVNLILFTGLIGMLWYVLIKLIRG